MTTTHRIPRAEVPPAECPPFTNDSATRTGGHKTRKHVRVGNDKETGIVLTNHGARWRGMVFVGGEGRGGGEANKTNVGSTTGERGYGGAGARGGEFSVVDGDGG